MAINEQNEMGDIKNKANAKTTFLVYFVSSPEIATHKHFAESL